MSVSVSRFLIIAAHVYYVAFLLSLGLFPGKHLLKAGVTADSDL